MTQAKARHLALDVGKPKVRWCLFLSVAIKVQACYFYRLPHEVVNAHGGVVTLDIPGNIRTPNTDDYLYGLQVAVPCDAALVIVIFIEIYLLRVVFGMDFVVDSVIERKQAFCPDFCSEASANISL